jgi:Ca2+/Na+ antiporter
MRNLKKHKIIIALGGFCAILGLVIIIWQIKVLEFDFWLFLAAFILFLLLIVSFSLQLLVSNEKRLSKLRKYFPRFSYYYNDQEPVFTPPKVHSVQTHKIISKRKENWSMLIDSGLPDPNELLGKTKTADWNVWPKTYSTRTILKKVIN